MIEAKEQMDEGHGYWLKWLSCKVGISERMAQRYMQLAREYGNTTSVSDLGITKALALLALPGDEREAFINNYHEVIGKQKKVDEMFVRDIKNTIQKRKEIREKRLLTPHTKKQCINKQQKCEEPSETSDSLSWFNNDCRLVRDYMDKILDFLKKSKG